MNNLFEAFCKSELFIYLFILFIFLIMFCHMLHVCVLYQWELHAWSLIMHAVVPIVATLQSSNANYDLGNGKKSHVVHSVPLTCQSC